MSFDDYPDFGEAYEESMKIMIRQEKDIEELKGLVKELREFIDDVVPQCPSGIDHLEYLKSKVDRLLGDK